MNRMLLGTICAIATTAACGGGSSSSGGSTTSPSTSPTTSAVAVTVASPLRIGETAQASGTATLTNGTTQAVTSGWLSDVPSVARVTDAGQVTGVSNGRANIYVVSGGKQGLLGIRVVPDYLGRWSGRIRFTGCSQTGDWVGLDFCGGFPIGGSDPFGLSVVQTGESLNARANYGDDVFPSASSSIQPDGSASFVTTYVATSSTASFSLEATWTINSARSGELTGTVNEVWRVTGVPGEGRLSQDIVGAVRTSTAPLVAAAGEPSLKFGIVERLFHR